MLTSANSKTNFISGFSRCYLMIIILEPQNCSFSHMKSSEYKEMIDP